jgi:hypothetical protein
VLAVVVALVLAPAAASAQGRGPGRVSTAATLSVLAGAVQRIPAGGGSAQPARDGASLAVGDRILTGKDATALVTFLDGSTVTVQPGSDVTVARADVGKGTARTGVRIGLGAVWARVARLADPGSGMTLESNTASATVHDGLIGGQQNADGSFVCWTQSPGMTVTDREGRTARLEPGQRATVKAGQEPAIAPFRVHQSALRITVPAGVLPLVLMPDGARVAGFVAPGVEVNQVFGSRTSAPADGGRGIEVPAGVPGPFLLVLEGERDVKDAFGWAAMHQGVPVYQQAMALGLGKGARLATTITLALDPATAAEPRTARVTGGSASPLAKHAGALPGRILLAPAEVESAAGR